MTPTPAPAVLPPYPLNVSHVTRRIRACEGETAAQVVLEYAMREYALAAIAAQPAIPEGWQLVPIQPDSNMMNSAPDAWYSWKSRDNGGNIQQLGVLMWERYLAAAPALWTPQELAAAKARAAKYSEWFTGTTPQPAQQEGQKHLAACDGGGVTQPLTEAQIDAVSKVLARCMDYPWEEMPMQGRILMREHAQAIIEAAKEAT